MNRTLVAGGSHALAAKPAGQRPAVLPAPRIEAHGNGWYTVFGSQHGPFDRFGIVAAEAALADVVEERRVTPMVERGRLLRAAQLKHGEPYVAPTREEHLTKLLAAATRELERYHEEACARGRGHDLTPTGFEGWDFLGLCRAAVGAGS